MVAVVSVETLLLVVLVVLVAGLLRSHAEILRRLGPPAEVSPIPAPAPPPRGAEPPAPTLDGTTPDGDLVTLDFGGGAGAPTLLAFLTTGCGSCAGFWETLGERRLATMPQTVIVTHEADRESPARLRSLAPADVPVVMSSHAWEDYQVPAAPYFVLVDGSVRGEGVATTWQALASLVRDAIEDQQHAQAPASGGPQRARQIDQTLAAAGIGPGDPSLYPGRD